MSEKKKFLYYYAGFGGLITSRLPVSRESEKTIWLQFSSHNEISIRKNKMNQGSGSGATVYYTETPELLAEYKAEVKYRMFLSKLEKLQSLGRNGVTPDIISNVLSIALPFTKEAG